MAAVALPKKRSPHPGGTSPSRGKKRVGRPAVPDLGPPLPPTVTSTDRLSLTICLALLVHGIIVLGVGFIPHRPKPTHSPTIEVILVQQQSEKSPEKADLLAQANLIGGGGDTEDKVHPSSPLPSTLPGTEATLGLAAAPMEAASTVIHEHPPDETATAAVDHPRQEHSTKPAKQPPRLTALRPKAQEAVAQADSAPAPAKTEGAEPDAETRKDSAGLPGADALISSSFNMAAADAELNERLEARAKRPRFKMLSANTKEYKYAAYLDAWRTKVERIGNLNYPDEARRQKLTGSLILEVRVKPDGSVEEIFVRTSSGYQILDDAAVRTVRLAAPFSAFPANIRSETDILHIVRTWQFLNNYRLATE
jgi:protein TonB